MLRKILRIHFKDSQCGFKAINRKILRKILPKAEDNEWFFDTEILFLAEKAGFKIKEIPVRWIEEGTIKKSKKTEKKNKKSVRKSKVKLLKTILNYLNSVNRLRQREK